MSIVNQIYFRVFKKYRRIESRVFTYGDADLFLKSNDSKRECDKWHIAREEDTNTKPNLVYLERRERIYE
jgi:hypothetical protein